MPPLIAAGIIAAGAAGGLTISATVASIAGYLIFTGVLVGLSLLFRPDVPKPEQGRIPLKQPIPPRVGVIGKARVGGAYMLYHEDPDSGRSVDVVALVSSDVINEFFRYYLHDDVVEIDGSGFVQELDDGRYGEDQVRIFTRTGVNPETAYSQVVSAVSPVWTSDHRGDGIGSAALLCDNVHLEDHGKFYPHNLPVPSFGIDVGKVFDSRDGTQDWNDPATWLASFNDNSILALVYFTTLPIHRGGLEWDMEECWVPVLDEIATEADICDEDVANKGGGTHKRYRCGGQWKFTGNPIDVLAAILGSMDGFLAERGDGAFTLKAGMFTDGEDDILITDKHIQSIRIKRFKEDENETSGVIVQYSSPDHEYSTVDSPIYPPAAYQGGDDARVRPADAIWCQNGRQAQRLAKILATEAMAEITGTLVLTMYGVTLLDRRWARLQTSDDPAFATEQRIKLTSNVVLDLAAGQVSVDFVLVDPAVMYAWDADAEEQNLQPAVTVPIGDGPAQPAGLVATPEQVGQSIIVDVTFPRPDGPNNQNYRLRWRVSDTGGGTPGGWTVVNYTGGEIVEAGGDVTLTLNQLGLGEFDIQAQSYTGGHSSSWSTSTTVDTASPAPGTPTSFTTTVIGADVRANFRAPNSANFDAAHVFRAISGAGFGAASDISGAVSGSPNQLLSYTDVTPGVGTFDYWVVAKNAAGTSSTPAGPETETTVAGLDASMTSLKADNTVNTADETF